MTRETPDVDFGRRLAGLRGDIPQKKWAARYGFTYGALRDLEQGRVKPTRAVQLLVKAIELAPDFMAAIAQAVTTGEEGERVPVPAVSAPDRGISAPTEAAPVHKPSGRDISGPPRIQPRGRISFGPRLRGQ